MRKLLSNSKIRLTAVKEEDLGTIENWLNDVEFLRYYDMIPAVPYNRKAVAEFIDSFHNSNERYIFAIRPIDSNNIIGVAGFDQIIWSNMVATVFIGIGNTDYKGKGLGKEAMSLLLDFGFNELNFYRLQLNVIAYNEKAIKLYEGQGFVKEGIFRQFIYRDGKRYDMYLYGLLRDEWISI